MAKKQHRLELATLALVSAFGAFSMCLAMPSRPSARWTTVASLQHVWTRDEFEKQVLARLPDLEHIQQYTVSKEETKRMFKEEGEFQRNFATPGFNWKKEKKDNNPPMTDVLIECDLYISSEEEIQLQNFFQDSFTTATCLTHGEFEKQSFKLMLAEIAETPSSVRAKLWQIERALKFGPDDISHPDVCVVCINGEQGQFDMAASAAKAALKKMGPQVLLKRSGLCSLECLS
ncbi:unnamed protein product [Effrenium voratum]|nr:unnamed protein product [Effrenium voratum]